MSANSEEYRLLCRSAFVAIQGFSLHEEYRLVAIQGFSPNEGENIDHLHKVFVVGPKQFNYHLYLVHDCPDPTWCTDCDTHFRPGDPFPFWGVTGRQVGGANPCIWCTITDLWRLPLLGLEHDCRGERHLAWLGKPPPPSLSRTFPNSSKFEVLRLETWNILLLACPLSLSGTFPF
jgi:hypothetical protein